jgi:hypothetical protein
MSTSRAVIPTFNMAIGFDVASTYFTPIWTRFSSVIPFSDV